MRKVRPIISSPRPRMTEARQADRSMDTAKYPAMGNRRSAPTTGTDSSVKYRAKWLMTCSIAIGIRTVNTYSSSDIRDAWINGHFAPRMARRNSHHTLGSWCRTGV
ncbi:hypothetical protein SAVIM40S_00740 [Streptomyces avidinii]